MARGFFDRAEIDNVLSHIKAVFGCYLGRGSTLEDMAIRLFRDDAEAFVSCCKAAQHILPLYDLFVSEPMTSLLDRVGLRSPNVNTPPLLHFSSPHVSQKAHHWKVPPHQDWPSNQGSLNGVTVWVPLVDVGADMGPLEVMPGSHLLGSLPHRLEEVPVLAEREDAVWVSLPMDAGDVVVFSAFLVHRSGVNHSDKIRLSAATRYNDLSERSYIDRKYPRPPPLGQRLSNDWPTAAQVRELWGVLCG